MSFWIGQAIVFITVWAIAVNLTGAVLGGFYYAVLGYSLGAPFAALIKGEQK